MEHKFDENHLKKRYNGKHENMDKNKFGWNLR